VSADDIPSDLESRYDASKTPPGPSDFDKLLEEYRKKFTFVYVVFDAFDECSDENEHGMLALFKHLEKSGYRLLISGRPQTPGQLQRQLTKSHTLELRADLSDLQHYVNKRLRDENINHKSLKTKLLKLVKKVDGM
jgi:hypothetical protein